MMTTGKTTSPKSPTSPLTPVMLASSTPPTTALTAASAQAMAKTCRTLMPISSAVCWSSATARMAMPRRDRWKNTLKAISATAARPMAQSRFSGMEIPATLTEPAGMKVGSSRGTVPQMSCTVLRRTAASPTVTMITEIVLWPTSGRSTRRSMATPSATAMTTARATPRVQCRP